MAEIKINLLPQDLTATKKEQKRRSLITNISITTLIVMILITAITLIVSLINKTDIGKVESQLNQSKNLIATSQEKEALLVILKTRINAIKSVSRDQSPATRAFNLITALMPPQIQLLNFTADKSNQITIGGETSHLSSLKRFFNILTDPAQNQGTIGIVKMNSLNVNAEGNLKFEIAFTLK